MSLTSKLLSKQNAETSSAIIGLLEKNKDFLALSKSEGAAILARDKEDASKLQAGIDYAKSKGVIDPNYVPEPYLTIDVLGKTPDDVADEIMRKVEDKKSKTTKGFVLVLCGLSGTGKGTTVSKLREKLDDGTGSNVVTWSNGNIFRSVTWLASTWCEQNSQTGFDAEKALTKDNLASFMSMLSFGMHNGKFDTRINGLGADMLVSEVQNTELKGPKVKAHIPTVAEQTQGEVILFAADAVKTLCDAGIIVLLEGREETVNYVRTPHRFTLVMSDEALIGKRRAAQRLMAATLEVVNDQDASTEDITSALNDQLGKMVQEVEQFVEEDDDPGKSTGRTLCCFRNSNNKKKM